jgi:hypothetical protein
MTDQTGYNNYVNPPPTPEDSSQPGLSAACLLNVSQDVQYLGAGVADGQAPPNCSSPDSQPGVPWVHHVQGGFYYGGYDPRFRFPQPDPEGEYPASRDFRNSIPQIPSPPADIQGDRTAPYMPPGSPNPPASLQMLTLEGSTGNKEEFKTADEMYVCFPDLGEYVLIFSFFSWDESTGGYKTVESSGSTEYPFVVRRRFGMQSVLCLEFIHIITSHRQA